MKYILASVTLLLALISGGPAGAADIPARAPVYKAPVPVVMPYSWSGFYVGGNVGYGWGRAESDITSSGAVIPDSALTDLVGTCPGGCPAGPFTLPGFAVSDRANVKGIIGGVQLGYNVQTSPNWVFGFETDFQGSGQKGTSDGVASSFNVTLPDTGCNAPTCSMSGTSATSYEAKIDWFGTVRGRVGYAADRVLVYGTGGLAYGHVKISGVNTTTLTVFDCCEPHLGGTFATPFSASKTKAGWTAGGGVEVAGWDRWTWKVEYLYMDLGKLQTTAVNGPLATTFITMDTRFTDHIVRFGVNYRFGG